MVRTTITKNVSCRVRIEGVSLLRGYDTGERKMTRGVAPPPQYHKPSKIAQGGNIKI
jgi:hypothetical protein